MPRLFLSFLSLFTNVQKENSATFVLTEFYEVRLTLVFSRRLAFVLAGKISDMRMRKVPGASRKVPNK
jgi:hypothetical protein